MNDQVDEIKQKNNIVDIVGQYVALKKNGRHHKGLCPFHKEKTPSFLVNDELNLYKCFGCGAGGDVIKFLMEIEGIDFLEALERLANRVGVILERKKREVGSEKETLYELMNMAARYYSWLLVSSKSGEMARKYLEGRGITPRIVETYGLGFSLDNWEGLKNYLVDKKGYKIELLERAGLVVRKAGGGYYDKFRGRLMFPLHDSSGKVVGFTARIIPGIAKEGEPKYLNSPETEIYHKGKNLYAFHLTKQAIRESKRVVLVEGQMDQISSYISGITETVAAGGTGITEDQIEMIARLADKIYLSLDADSAGYVAMKRTVNLAEKRGLMIKIVQLEGGKDPDEISRNSPSAWKKMVENAVDVYEFVLDRSVSIFGSKTVEEISKVLSEVVPFLVKIENGIIRELWAKRLAEKIGVSVNSVLTEIDRFRSGKLVGLASAKKEKSISETKVDRLTKMVIANLFTKPYLSKSLRKILVDLVGGGGLWKILSFVLDQSEKYTNSAELIKSMPAEMREVANEIYMSVDDLETDDKGTVELAVNLAREKIRELRNELSEKREEAEKNGETKNEEEILLKMRDLGERENRLFSIDLP